MILLRQGVRSHKRLCPNVPASKRPVLSPRTSATFTLCSVLFFSWKCRRLNNIVLTNLNDNLWKTNSYLCRLCCSRVYSKQQLDSNDTACRDHNLGERLEASTFLLSGAQQRTRRRDTYPVASSKVFHLECVHCFCWSPKSAHIRIHRRTG